MNTIMLRRAGLVFCLFTTVITLAWTKNVESKRNRIILGDDDFYLVRQGTDKEFWLSYNGFLASDTSTHNGYQKIIFRQVTDGSSLYQGVFDNEGDLKDCELKTKRRDVTNFVREFHRDSQGGRKHPTGANITVSYTPLVEGTIDGDLETYIDGLIDYPTLLLECRALHESMNKVILQRHHQMQAYTSTRNKRSLIFPGTKWCGNGNSAKHENDLGTDVNTDRCCREHDKCPYYILGFETKWHLYNGWFGTVSHCDCDNSFKTCLRSARTGTAHMVGNLFFNFIKRSCFVLRKRKVCTKRSWWGSCKKRQKTLVGRYKTIKKFKTL